jgi:aryl-alcohol dehydrogenase-like predicted oxidoreductase
MLKFWDGPLGVTLERLRAAGWIENLGASLYTKEELERALMIPSLRLIQMPFHVFDQDLDVRNMLREAQRAGRRIFVRSVFLQGLLVMDPKAATARVPGAGPYLSRWWDIVAESGRSAASVALHFVRASLPEADLIVGCETAEQLEANARLTREPSLEPRIIERLREFASVPETIKSPRFWSDS